MEPNASKLSVHARCPKKLHKSPADSAIARRRKALDARSIQFVCFFWVLHRSWKVKTDLRRPVFASNQLDIWLSTPAPGWSRGRLPQRLARHMAEMKARSKKLCPIEGQQLPNSCYVLRIFAATSGQWQHR